MRIANVLLSACCALMLVLGAMPALALPVDANTATETQLQQVRGIGPGIARRIVEERRRAGPFADLADLERRVRGLGPSNVRRMSAAGLAVGPAGTGGPSTLAARPEASRAQPGARSAPGQSAAQAAGGGARR